MQSPLYTTLSSRQKSFLAFICRQPAEDPGQQAVGEDCCAWELLQLFYILAPRLEGLVTQVCPALPYSPTASVALQDSTEHSLARCAPTRACHRQTGC